MLSASPGMVRLSRGTPVSREGSWARIPSGVGSCGLRICRCRDRISSRVDAGGGAAVVSGAGEGAGGCACAVAVHARASAPTAAATILFSVTVPPTVLAWRGHESGSEQGSTVLKDSRLCHSCKEPAVALGVSPRSSASIFSGSRDALIVLLARSIESTATKRSTCMPRPPQSQ